MAKRKPIGTILYQRSLKVIVSDALFAATLVLAFLQGLWFLLTIQQGGFDEGEHFGFISAYAHRLSPFFTHQPPNLDYLGEVVRQPSYLYYYLMSWPLRIIDLVTHNTNIQLISLRLISLVFFLVALVVYRKLLRRAGISKAVSNLTLLFMVLTPSIAPMAGALNYDSVVFLIAGLLLLQAVYVVQGRALDFRRLAYFLILGLLGCLIQFELLALFVPLAFYIGYDVWKKHRRKLFVSFRIAFMRVSPGLRIGLCIALVISAGLFIERPVYNLAKYHTISPSCVRLVSAAGCMQNYTEARNLHDLAIKPASFQPDNPFFFMLTYWIPLMVSSESRLLPWGSTAVINGLFYIFAILGSCLILIYLRDFLKNAAFRLLLFAMLAYVLLLAGYLYSNYLEFGQPIAITSRYLLLVMPFFLAFTAMGLVRLFSQHRQLLVGLGAGLLLVFATQGGGIETAVIEVPSSNYWQRSYVLQFNNNLRHFFLDLR